jgi:PLD-like domain
MTRQAPLRHVRSVAWPAGLRPKTPKGTRASLHAKCAVADGKRLLVSSANLTEFELTLTMELGLLVEGNDAPQRIQRHIEALIEQVCSVQSGGSDVFSGLIARPSGAESSINGSMATAYWSVCKEIRVKSARFARLLQSPLADSNRRPPPYHGGALPTELRGRVGDCSRGSSRVFPCGTASDASVIVRPCHTLSKGGQRLRQRCSHA